MVPNQQLIEQLKRDEGAVLDANGYHKPYQDSLGIWTIGYGHNCQTNPITDAAANQILVDDIAKAEASVLREWPWAQDLDIPRRNVLINMVFNMGLAKVRGFVNFLECLKQGQYINAAEHMLDSLWAKQVGDRAKRLAEVIRWGHG